MQSPVRRLPNGGESNKALSSQVRRTLHIFMILHLMILANHQDIPVLVSNVEVGHHRKMNNAMDDLLTHVNGPLTGFVDILRAQLYQYRTFLRNRNVLHSIGIEHEV